MNLLNILLFCLGVVAYSIKELTAHGKLKWGKHNPFWDEDSWERKYASDDEGHILPAPKTWYYKIVGAKYKERWFTSTWITVNFTDGYHACQSLMFILFSLSLSIGTTLNFFLVWGSVLVVNFVTYRVLQK